MFDSAEEADRFLTYLNNLHSSIQFTIDKESHDKLPLLDLLLIKDSYYDEENISITLYRKPTQGYSLISSALFLFSTREA